jgi:hypothetical protein
MRKNSRTEDETFALEGFFRRCNLDDRCIARGVGTDRIFRAATARHRRYSRTGEIRSGKANQRKADALPPAGAGNAALMQFYFKRGQSGRELVNDQFRRQAADPKPTRGRPCVRR